MPQNGALFPHLTSLDNVAYGLGGRRGRGPARESLRRLGIEELSASRPAQLSAGQAQKVALTRHPPGSRGSSSLTNRSRRWR